MRLSEGVEWAVHACAVLATLPAGAALSAGALARFHDLPTAYMAKHLQRLSRAGLVKAVRGARGGYRLARPPAGVSLWDIRQAIEGQGPDFKCRNIRLRGPCAAYSNLDRPCPIASAYWSAEAAYRDSLAGVTLANIVGDAAVGNRRGYAGAFAAWLSAERAVPNPVTG